MREIDNLIPLSELQLQEQLSTIVGFLSEVHPSLIADGKSFKPCIEIRPVYRGEGRNYILKRSFNLWDLSEKTKNLLYAFLQRHNGQPTCLYYSVFSYDNVTEAVTAKGEKAKPGKITSSTALYTNEVALDFDNIDYGEYIKLITQFESMGIHAIWVFSGHGYQAHILLEEDLYDKTVLKRVVYKFRAKGFDCDPACIDPARVMRLPGTFNCKCLLPDSPYDELEPPHCTIEQDSVHRYSLEDIFAALDKLPTVSPEDEAVFEASTGKKEAARTTGKAPVSQPVASEDEKDVVSVRRIEYPYLSNYELPEALSKMLAYTPLGYRNKVLGFMIRFFKNYLRMSKEDIQEVCTIWAREACSPAYSSEEFAGDFSRLYKMNGLSYDTAMAQKFGIIDFSQLVTLRKRDISISSLFFADLSKLDGKTVRLYLAIKMLEHIEKPATMEELCNLLGVSDRALRPTLKDLCASGHGYMTKANRRLGIPYTYHTHRLYSPHKGYVSFSYNDIRAYVTELYEGNARGNGELKLYLFMRYKFFKGDVFMSQNNLGKNIGVARNTVSEIAYRLQDKHFLKITKIRRGFAESCEYLLLR